MLGKVLAGHYKVTKHLGGGGFGRTYVAQDLHLPGKPLVIIKHLKPISSMQEVLEMARDLFDREAKVLYRLGKHDQIPTLLAHFEEDEEFFLAQDYIHGHTLNQEIQRGRKQSEAYVINFLHQLLPLLEFVHSQQVIHRDIKPSNIMRRKSDGKLVLIDFGAVKEVSTQSLQDQTITRSGLAIGSPGYMPNEQYGGRAQYASDIYAVGVTCIQALTGIAPRDFPEDEATNEIVWRHLVKVSDPLADLLDKMVRFDFRQRYRSVAEVMVDLSKIPMPKSVEAVKPIPVIKVGEADRIPDKVQDKSPVIAPDTLEILPITQIVENLSSLEDQLRVKKLMFLVCTGILENDPERLAGYEMQDLVLSIYEISPNPDQLKIQLFNAVQTIAPAKQPQYLALAKSIYGILLPLYGILSPEEQAASALESDLQQLRVKKLLLYVCRQTWENDLAKLQQVKIGDLLHELRQIAPSLPKLKSLLDESVKATSKPSEYMAIADLILERLAISYDPDAPALADPLLEAEPSLPDLTGLSPELFDIRLELMRYCNPLRLKMLLYAATKSATQGSMDWTELKVHDLDSLLRSLLQNCDNLNAVQNRLCQAAANLQPSDIYQQIINQLLRVLKTIYQA
jgi:serine/threonine protein kinase